MNRTELASRLASAERDERAALLTRHATLADSRLAWALKELYDEAESSDLARAAGVAEVLAVLANAADDPEVSALAEWTGGMAALDSGRLEEAIARLDEAETRFGADGQPLAAAQTQVSKLRALAMLGRYDEALECGRRSRDVFVFHGDNLAAGKAEQNLGNIYFRRDQYMEAEQLYRTARERFSAVGDQKQLAQIDNCMATTLSAQHKFRDARSSLQQALERAEAAGLEVTLAEIECNLGCFALFQGHFDRALDYLERSRRRYAALEMPHESAIAEQELADAYLELNLAPEAIAIYSRVTPVFADLGMRAEQARALAYHGRASLVLGQSAEARVLLAEARMLYAAEGNLVGEAMVTLTEAQAFYVEGDYAEAASAAGRAETPLSAAGNWGRSLLARWLRGEATRAQGQTREAQTLLETALHDAERQTVPQVAQRCYTSLGMLAATMGELKAAEAYFKQAVELIEELRAPLPAEEFRTAFLADKLTPYVELVRLCLSDGSTDRVVEALRYVERARSRALVDMLGGALPASLKARDPFEAELLARLEELREELNWFYSQINRPDSEAASRGATAMVASHKAVRERETMVLGITRQLQQRSHEALVRIEPLDIGELQSDFGDATALVEYYSLDGQWLAFVVTDEGVEVVRQLGSEAEVEEVLTQLRFQLGALRHGVKRLTAHLPQLTQRARHHLRALYDLLLRPIEGRLGTRRLLVVPHRALHYVPFHALHDGMDYVIERREVCYAPSASVLHHCLAAPRRPVERAVLLGVPDAEIPRVRDEVVALQPLFPWALALLDEQATRASLSEQAPAADVLHLACHGQFRPDNPLFSSLRLADGWLTVRDAYGLDLHCELVTLSACETGISHVAPGDELIGLARGFFSAGAPSLLVSLWTVDDEATANLMTSFYVRLLAGEGPACALRSAQCELLGRYPHPFFWSPFALIGRW